MKNMNKLLSLLVLVSLLFTFQSYSNIDVVTNEKAETIFLNNQPQPIISEVTVSITYQSSITFLEKNGIRYYYFANFIREHKGICDLGDFTNSLSNESIISNYVLSIVFLQEHYSRPLINSIKYRTSYGNTDIWDIRMMEFPLPQGGGTGNDVENPFN